MIGSIHMICRYWESKIDQTCSRQGQAYLRIWNYGLGTSGLSTRQITIYSESLKVFILFLHTGYEKMAIFSLRMRAG